jgi:arginine kinase
VQDTESGGGVYEISSKRRLGLTGFEAVKEMQNGILELINIEKCMQ